MTQPMLDLVCLVCGGSFSTAKPLYGRYRRFCSSACRRSRHLSQLDAYRVEGRYAGRYTRVAPAVRRTIAKVCLVCDLPFETTNRATVCCGTVCGQVLRARRAGATRSARSVEERQRVCERCHAPFIARHPSGSGIAGKSREGRFCSRRCADGFRRNGADAGQPLLAGIVAEIGGNR